MADQIGCGRPSQYRDAVACGVEVTNDGEPFTALCAQCIGVLLDGDDE